MAQLDASAGNADGGQFKTQSLGSPSSVRERFDRAVANLSGVMQRFQGLPGGGYCGTLSQIAPSDLTGMISVDGMRLLETP